MFVRIIDELSTICRRSVNLLTRSHTAAEHSKLP
jgi:hypothetical protein